MAKVTLRNVGKKYSEGHYVVKDFSIDIADRDFIVFVGPSGCGKSTTLRMIAGLEEITEGDIYIDDVLVNDVEPQDRDIAMVFQNYALYPHMTVYDNIAFPLRQRKVPTPEIERAVQDAARILRLEKLLKRKPKALSGGERQRVAMGRAIVRKPKVFLMDEPLSNLDSQLRVQMRTEIARLYDTLGATIIYVTHDQTEAMTMGTRIVVLKDGIVQQIDTPHQLYNHPKNMFVAGFIGSPKMNFFEGILREEGGRLYFSTSRCEWELPAPKYKAAGDHFGKPVIAGIRPEHVHVSSDRADFFAQVTVKEPLGAETFLYLDDEDLQWIVRTAPSISAEVHQKIGLRFDVEKIHLFDAVTESSLLQHQ